MWLSYKILILKEIKMSNIEQQVKSIVAEQLGERRRSYK